MGKSQIDGKAKKELTAEDLPYINQALENGELVEIMKLRDGNVKARTVRKKEMLLPTAQ